MATKNIVPRADKEGSVGTAAKRWVNGHFVKLNADNLICAAYATTVDYVVGALASYGGNVYRCIAANGPASVVKTPTDPLFWIAGITEIDGGVIN